MLNRNIAVRLSQKFLEGPRGQSESLRTRFSETILREKATFLEGVRLPRGANGQHEYNLMVLFSTGQTLAGLGMDDIEWLPE